MRIYLFFIISLGILSCKENESNQVNSQENTSTIIKPSFDKKNAFLERSEIQDSLYQAELFRRVQGLWHFDKIELTEDEKDIEKYHEDHFFMEGMVWPLDYPCCWPHKYLGERVYMTEDSIFFSTDGYPYLNKYQFEIRKDTLFIYGTTSNGNGHFIEYYTRREYDQVIIDSLGATGFNKQCLSGKWKLDQIFDFKMENYSLEYESFDYIPKHIDFKEYQIHGNLIYLENDESKKFEIVSVRRLNEDYGGGLSIWLQDITPTKEGFTYIYHPE